MNDKEMQLLHYLKANCAGRKKIKCRSQLQEMFHVSKKQLTHMVHRLRCLGVPIAGGAGGYYFALNAGEIDATIRWLEKMVKTIEKAIDGLRASMVYFGPSQYDWMNGDGGGDGP